MSCNNCKEKPVWRFTNQVQLCKNCFCNYFERKVFATIRKYQLMPKDRIFRIKTDKSINSKVLYFILRKKFQVVNSKKQNISYKSMSSTSEEIFSNLIKGKFSIKIDNSPLSDLSDKEIGMYAELNNINGNKNRKDKKINSLFEKFISKNPDLEHNIINAFNQINK